MKWYHFGSQADTTSIFSGDEKRASTWNKSSSLENWKDIAPGLRNGYGPEQLFTDIKNSAMKE